MSGPGDKPDKPDKPDPAPEKDGKAAERNMTVTPAKVAHAPSPARSKRTAIPAAPGHTGEPMEIKGAETPATEGTGSGAKPGAPAAVDISAKPAADAAAQDGAPDEKAAKKARKKASKEPKQKAPKGPRRRGVFSWFFAGLGLAVALVGGLASWNVWADPHYVVSPRLDALMQDFGGYVAAATLFGLALIAVSLLRGRAAFATTAFIAVLGVLVAVATTVLLGIGAAILCGRQPVFAAGSPDRRMVVIAVRGRCGVTREFTYRVSVRELGPSVPRETMIFQSFGRPAPSEVVFTGGGTISVLIKSSNAEAAPRYTVTIDRKTFKPDRVWRFDVRTD